MRKCFRQRLRLRLLGPEQRDARSDGPIVGSTVKFNNNVQNDTFPTIVEVPAGMPGTDVIYAQPNPPEMFAG